MTPQQVVDVLIEECGCPVDLRDDIIRSLDDNDRGEYRFCGTLGFGGKLYWDRGNRYRVNCYQEDATPERRAAIDRANARLKETS